MDLIELIKQRRYLSMALHKLLPRKDRQALKEQTSYFGIDPDEESDADETKEKKQERQGQLTDRNIEPSQIELVENSADLIRLGQMPIASRD